MWRDAICKLFQDNKTIHSPGANCIRKNYTFLSSSVGHECTLQGRNNILVYTTDASLSKGFKARISASPFCPVERYHQTALYLSGTNGTLMYPPATGNYGNYERVLAVLPKSTATPTYVNLGWINATKESDWLNIFTVYPLHLQKNLSLERR